MKSLLGGDLAAFLVCWVYTAYLGEPFPPHPVPLGGSPGYLVNIRITAGGLMFRAPEGQSRPSVFWGASGGSAVHSLNLVINTCATFEIFFHFLLLVALRVPRMGGAQWARHVLWD